MPAETKPKSKRKATKLAREAHALAQQHAQAAATALLSKKNHEAALKLLQSAILYLHIAQPSLKDSRDPPSRPR